MKRITEVQVQLFTLRRCLAGVLRRTWLVVLITVISCAAFAARAASALVAAETLEPTRTAASPAPARPSPPAISRRHGDHGQLLDRNIFCSSCAPAGPGVAAAFVLPPAVLIETSVGSEPSATLRVVATEVQGSWGLGDTVPGLGLLDRIAPKWIELVDGAGHRGRLSLLEPPAARGPEPAPSDDPAVATPWRKRLRKIDEQTYEVDRDLVRELVSGGLKPGTARFLPVFDHGELQAVRLSGVTSQTIPYALGLQSRDTLTAIDGEPIKQPQQLIDLYARLDQLNTVELSGMRAGKPLVRILRLR